MRNTGAQVVVVGAGITGLACAQRLLARGIEPLVLEAGDRVGGKITTVREAGYEFEAGPNTLMASSQGVFDLIRDAGLETEVIEPSPAAKKRYVLFHGALRAVPMSPISALTSPLLGPMGVLGVIGDLFKRRPAETPDDETVTSFVRRRFGRRVLENLVSPFLSGVYAGDPDRLEAASSLRKLVEAERHSGGSVMRGLIGLRRAAGKPEQPRPKTRSITFRGGLCGLPERLAERLGDRVRLNTPVESLDIDDHECIVRTGDGGEIVCDRVILACEPPAAAPLVQPLDGGDPIARDLAEIEIACVSVIGLAFKRTDVAHPLDGFGYLAGPGASGPVLGCLFRSSIFPHTAPEGEVLLAAFVGGARHDIRGISDTQILTLALTEISQRLGITARPTRTFHRRWPVAIAQANQGHAARRQRIAAWSAGNPVSIISSAVFGVPLNDCIVGGQTEAERIATALVSATRATREVQPCP